MEALGPPARRLVELFEIENPIVLAPMAGFGTVELAAADFKTRDKGTEAASLIQFLLCRDRTLARDPADWGLTDESPENLIRM